MTQHPHQPGNKHIQNQWHEKTDGKKNTFEKHCFCIHSSRSIHLSPCLGRDGFAKEGGPTDLLRDLEIPLQGPKHQLDCGLSIPY